MRMRNNLRGQAKKRAARQTIAERALRRMIGKNERTRRKPQSENAFLELRANRSMDSVDRTDDYYSRRLGY